MGTSSSSQPLPHDINSQQIQYKNSSIKMDKILNNLQDMSHDKAPKTLSNELQELLQQIDANPDEIDIDRIEQLLFHRNDLKKYLNGIDKLLLQHKDKISDNQQPATP